MSNPCEVENRESSVPQLIELLQSEWAETLKLKQKIALLEARVQELERNTPVFLGQQADMLVDKRSLLTVCGCEHFCDFSIDSVICELRRHVQDVYAPFMHLGDVERNMHAGEATSLPERKAVSALCTLLNAQCSRVKGMQLLLSVMLIARYTVKQLSKTSVQRTCTCSHHS